MASSGQPEETFPRRFEVIATSLTQVEALGRLAAEHGIPLYARPEEEVISPQVLEMVSQELWQRTEPGSLASSMLDRLKGCCDHSGVIRNEQGLYRIALPFLYSNNATVMLGGKNLNPHEINSRAYAALDAIYAPFDFVLAVPTPEGRPSRSDKVRTITPLAVTRAGLKRYVQGRNFRHHDLHEDLGRALDTLVYTAGLRSADEPFSDRTWEGDFISREALWTRFKGEGFSGSQFGTLSQKIITAANSQIYSGKPDVNGEVVLKSSDLNKWDEIAAASLPKLAAHYEVAGAVPTWLRSYF